MATVTSIVGTKAATPSSTAHNSLASATYVSVGALNHVTNKPLDVLVEVNAVPGTVSGNKQLVVFAQASLDAGSTFTTGPTSGTTTTDEPDLYFVGILPLNTNSTLQTKTFSLAAAFGGVLPQQTKIILKNDSGAALATSGSNVVNYSEVTGSVA